MTLTVKSLKRIQAICMLLVVLITLALPPLSAIADATGDISGLKATVVAATNVELTWNNPDNVDCDITWFPTKAGEREYSDHDYNDYCIRNISPNVEYTVIVSCTGGNELTTTFKTPSAPKYSKYSFKRTKTSVFSTPYSDKEIQKRKKTNVNNTSVSTVMDKLDNSHEYFVRVDYRVKKTKSDKSAYQDTMVLVSPSGKVYSFYEEDPTSYNGSWTSVYYIVEITSLLEQCLDNDDLTKGKYKLSLFTDDALFANTSFTLK